MADRKLVQQLAESHLAAGDPLGWFEALYVRAAGRAEEIPWADLSPHGELTAWVARQQAGSAPLGRVLVVGCGLGDDAQYLAERGARVTAFDISPTAIAWCRQRFRESTVDFREANLLELPEAWRGAFDLVVEIFTLQALPLALRPAAIRAMAECLAAAGRLLLVCRAREAWEAWTGPPWPVARVELAAFVFAGLREEEFRDFVDQEAPPVRRFQAEYRRVAKPALPGAG